MFANKPINFKKWRAIALLYLFLSLFLICNCFAINYDASKNSLSSLGNYNRVGSLNLLWNAGIFILSLFFYLNSYDYICKYQINYGYNLFALRFSIAMLILTTIFDSSYFVHDLAAVLFFLGYTYFMFSFCLRYYCKHPIVLTFSRIMFILPMGFLLVSISTIKISLAIAEITWGLSVLLWSVILGCNRGGANA